MVSQEQQGLFDEIINKGCCDRCALRYLGYSKTLITFDYPNTCLANFGFIPDTEEPKYKNRKKNPCSVCLGVLQDTVINNILEHEDLDKVEKYQHQSFVAYITFPTCILIRDHSMKIHLKKTFPESFDESKVIKINNAWRYSVEDRLCLKLNKSYDRLSKLSVHFFTDYILAEEELAVVQKHVDQHLSKHTVVALLESIPDEIFETLVQVPSRIPLYEAKVKNLKYWSESIHLIGKYCKYSRELPQKITAFSPLPVQTSIETILLNALKNTLSEYKEVEFQASSFDDVNIRVLGGGRTFHLKILNPKFENVTSEDCSKIEELIKQNGMMEVKNLREADKKDIRVYMDSECIGTRLYKVLCLVEKGKDIDDCVNAINMFNNLTVRQKTPMRVVQRDIRIKRTKILHIKASKVKDKQDQIELELCTECSFYVPEFIHGDFGRSVPSLRDIIKAKVECLAIDIIDFTPTFPCAVEADELLF